MAGQSDNIPITGDLDDEAVNNSANESGDGPPVQDNANLLSDRYNMEHAERGFALIINNVDFKGTPPLKDLRKRGGSDKDADMMYFLFETLGFEEITKEDNLSAKAMEQNFKSVAETNHSNKDCFACVILSHGDKGRVYGSDCNTVEIEKLIEHVKGKKCSSLVGKPKLFFIQACQGSLVDPGVEGHDGESGESDPEIPQKVNIVPTEADVLVAHSTSPGYKAWRNTDKGSWFIQSVADIITEQWQDQDLLTMMTRVCNKVAHIQSSNSEEKCIKQMPCVTSTLTKDLFFSENK